MSTCPNCGSSNVPTASACASCGIALPSQPAPAQAVPPGPFMPGPSASAFRAPTSGAGTGAPRPSDSAGLVLALGIVALFVPIVAPVAWFLGQVENNKIKRGEAAPSGAVTAGWILGIVLTCGYALLFLFVLPALLEMLSLL